MLEFIVFGYFFVLLDIGIQRFDLLNDTVGYIMIVIALGRIPEKNKEKNDNKTASDL